MHQHVAGLVLLAAASVVLALAVQQLVASLLELVPDPDPEPSRADPTPMHQAAGAGHVEIVRMLPDVDAYVDAMDQDGRTNCIRRLCKPSTA